MWVGEMVDVRKLPSRTSTRKLLYANQSFLLLFGSKLANVAASSYLLELAHEKTTRLSHASPVKSTFS